VISLVTLDLKYIYDVAAMIERPVVSLCGFAQSVLLQPFAFFPLNLRTRKRETRMYHWVVISISNLYHDLNHELHPIANSTRDNCRRVIIDR